MSIVFICELPPPYGGVTVKNQLIIDQIFSPTDPVRVIDMYAIRRNPFSFFRIGFQIIFAFIRRDTILYGFGTYKRVETALTIQKLFGGWKSLSRTVNVVMGGVFQHYVIADSHLKSLVSAIKCNLVETAGMKKELLLDGVENVMVFPNPKPDNTRANQNHSGRLKCVFFSKICKGKGVDYIISEISAIPDPYLSIDFYGPVDPEINDDFYRFIDTCEYARYHGIFNTSEDDLYSELSQYDLVLLPTRLQTEGIPGVLIETKMAGVAALVSDINYNSEIVQNDAEGIVLKDMERGTMANELIALQNDRERLEKLKMGAFHSRKRYCLDNFRSKLRQLLELD